MEACRTFASPSLCCVSVPLVALLFAAFGTEAQFGRGRSGREFGQGAAPLATRWPVSPLARFRHATT